MTMNEPIMNEISEWMNACMNAYLLHPELLQPQMFEEGWKGSGYEYEIALSRFEVFPKTKRANKPHEDTTTPSTSSSPPPPITTFNHHHPLLLRNR